MQDKNFIKLTDQDAALLEQGASMLEGLENDERNRGNCSTAEGAGCSAHAVRRLASALLAHEREIDQCLHQIQEPAAAEQAAWHAGLDEGRAQAAPAAVAVPDERAAFEAWAKSEDMSVGSDCDGYIHANTAAASQAWQARAALAATPAAAQEHELIDWDSAHKIAFQAAAAFRPSYFKGAGFVAHNWVVEAIRSGHIDGQRHALGLPPIDRSGAHAAKLRLERSAAMPTAALVVPPQPDATIKEMMELVNTLIASINEAHHANSEGWRDGCFQAADNTHKAIESKLRALLATATGLPAQAVETVQMPPVSPEQFSRDISELTGDWQADARDAEQEVLMEHSGCGSNTQVDMLTVRLNPGDKVVMHKGRITQGFDRANRAAIAAAKGEKQ